eukprot:5323738-Ditylum_brightwellii.AAC.1
MADAREFEEAHKDETDFDGKAINHAEDFSLWTFGVGTGLIKETRFKVKPDDEELKGYCNSRQRDRVLPPTGSDGNILSNTAGDNTSVLTQLTAAMPRQSEYAERANEMRKEELTRKKEKEDKKKDRLCDLHKTTLNMLVMASATDCDDTPSDTAESCR